MIRSIKNEPSRFVGLRTARGGFVAATLATVIVGTLIGITVPERLRQRQLGIEAGVRARIYAIDGALMDYRELHGFIPPPDEMITELSKLPDPDGAIAAALREIDINGYKPTMVVAAASTKSKATSLRSSALRNGVTRVDQPLESVSFTNYDLRLPGEDKILNTDDDLIVRDGLIMTVPEFKEFKEYVSTSGSTP